MNDTAGLDEIANLHARDGHLTMLSMDRFERGELEMRLHEAVAEHLDQCELCAERFDAIERDAVHIVPPRTHTPSRARVWMTTTLTAALAASLLVALWPKPQQASLGSTAERTLTSSSYTTSAAQEYGPAASLELHAFVDEQGHRRVVDGDALGMDESLRIEVKTRTGGWFALVLDTVERPEVHPDDGAEDTEGAMHDRTTRVLSSSQELAKGDSWTHVVHAATDGLAFEERLVAVLCPEPFEINPSDLVEGFEVMELTGLPEGCTSRALEYARWGRIASS